MKIIEEETQVLSLGSFGVVVGYIDGGIVFNYYTDNKELHIIPMSEDSPVLTLHDQVELENYCIKEWKKKRLEGLF
jgi:hypothetical protein